MGRIAVIAMLAMIVDAFQPLGAGRRVLNDRRRPRQSPVVAGTTGAITAEPAFIGFDCAMVALIAEPNIVIDALKLFLDLFAAL